MFNYTHNNHFRFGYDGQWFNLPTAYSQELQVDYGTVNELISTFEFECRKAVRHIYKAADGLPINLSFSGGVDSEIMVRMFMAEENPFNITILKFAHDLNLHDVSFAVSFCESNGLQYEIMYLDVEEFFRSDEFMDFAERTNCISPQITTHIWLLHHMHGLPVFGCGEGGLVKTIPHSPVSGWTHPVSEKHLAMYRYCLQTERKAIPGFFRYTPGQLYKFMDNPMVRELGANKKPGKLSTQTSKCAIYQSWFPDMVTRRKYNGFEKIAEQEQKVRDSLMAKMPKYNREARIEYHTLMRKLYKKHSNDHPHRYN